MSVMFIVNTIAILFLLVGFLMLVYALIKGKQNVSHLIPVEIENPSFCILIPAREESKVITGLLKSIQKQTVSVSFKDVYIIVEREDDPTVGIAKEYGATVIVRKYLDKKRKGYALDEAVQDILTKKIHYDLYFIMDADNVMKPDFIEKMLETYRQGYDMAIGYRNCKNGNDNVVAACSGLTFSMINTVMNYSRAKRHGNIILSGTGLYITGRLIEQWQGFPFHSLTEDYEMSLYSILHSLSTTYNLEAEFYDEQPTKYRQSRIQRTRWIRGFLDSRKQYIKKFDGKNTEPNRGQRISERMGIKPFVVMVIGAGLFILNSLVGGLVLIIQGHHQGYFYLWLFLGMLLFVYLVLFVFTASMFILEKDRIHMKLSMKIKCVFYNPIFLASYVPCILEAIFKKDIGWQPIEHFHNDIQ